MELPGRQIDEYDVLGYRVGVDLDLGHLWVEHETPITWDELQAIKNWVWGENARAIEVYPAQSDVVNNAPMRHLWRLGESDFAPDLLGFFPPDVRRGLAQIHDRLEQRCRQAWEGT